MGGEDTCPCPSKERIPYCSKLKTSRKLKWVRVTSQIVGLKHCGEVGWFSDVVQFSAHSQSSDDPLRVRDLGKVGGPGTTTGC